MEKIDTLVSFHDRKVRQLEFECERDLKLLKLEFENERFVICAEDFYVRDPSFSMSGISNGGSVSLIFTCREKMVTQHERQVREITAIITAVEVR